MDHFPKISVKIDGSTLKNKRMGIVEDFQTNKKIKIFIGNYKAAGIGITLTAASHVGLLEYPWTPGELAQAIDRVHRIGQKNAVNVYYLYAQETIEKKLVKLLDNKVQVLNGVLDGEYSGINNIFPELLKDLVNI
jgi:SWI/SNF-related matrix-associated actin-dependent regulator 1 of chromatin subfamily A